MWYKLSIRVRYYLVQPTRLLFSKITSQIRKPARPQDPLPPFPLAALPPPLRSQPPPPRGRGSSAPPTGPCVTPPILNTVTASAIAISTRRIATLMAGERPTLHGWCVKINSHGPCFSGGDCFFVNTFLRKSLVAAGLLPQRHKAEHNL